MPVASVLVLCTGNSCRSQMAEGVLKSLDPELQVHSAGTEPAGQTHPLAVKVMAEAGIDIAAGYPKSVERFLDKRFDYVITVCGGARESCPAFTGEVGKRLHIGFDDPAKAEGSDEEVLEFFRRVREEIREGFESFYRSEVRKEG